MSDENVRTIDLTRIERARYRVTNPRGGFLEIGEGDDTNFTPVELLLAAIAGCTAIDVDYLTTKRSEPQRFDIVVSGVKKVADDGNRLEDIVVGFDVTFPDDEAGRQAADRLEVAIDRSHDRLCTVSRTVELGTPVQAGLRS
ncbi:OsmC family peroxiredoxin [Aeromicrobium phragmitis]|uniref:OsmC family peroxiredoxin n=1 Tax=Aeromicrobium phragmitis TaxID=2478914 RepID=A0A3L8PHB5_9ACTN|nr:OsmC family protein [Aeromicrobium phragmitis]RLV54575.1 OsmC family peroxiredoxin [Aeromicrobium phragmitis]